MNETLKHLVQFLEKEAPDKLKYMKGPATADEIAAVEDQIGLKLPSDLVNLYKVYNGFSPLNIVEVKEIAGTVKWFREFDEFTDSDAKPGEGVKKKYFSDKWIPFVDHANGNFECIDQDPGAGGKRNQVIYLDHEGIGRYVSSQSLDEWLEKAAKDLVAYVEKKKHKASTETTDKKPWWKAW